MLGANLSQKLDENDGVLGFLEDDLTKEAKRASRLVSEVMFDLKIALKNCFFFFNNRLVFIVNFVVQASVAVSVAVANIFTYIVQ